MGIATEIVKFYNPNTLPKIDGKVQPTSLQEFSNVNPGLNLLEVVQCCNILERKGILLKIGSKNNSLMGPCYISKVQSSKKESYGSYDLLCGGFKAVRKKTYNSIYPVIVTKSDSSFDIGTAFYSLTEYGLYMITAFHCIEGMRNVKIPLSDNENFTPLNIYRSSIEGIDIAVIKINKIHSNGFPLFLGEGEVLDEILAIGYPPISGFEPFQIASTGMIVGEENSYLDKMDYLLVNARVKGGNSGGPIINNLGFVCGILVHIPTNPHDNTKLDDLGYGLGLKSKEILKIIKNANSSEKENVVELSFEFNEHGFKLT